MRWAAAVVGVGLGLCAPVAAADQFSPAFGGTFAFPAGQHSLHAVAADFFNGDGLSDLAVATSDGAGQTGGVWILRSNVVEANASHPGTGTVFSLSPTPGSPLLPGAAATDLVTGDFNGDGNADLAVAGPSGLTILLGHGDGTFSQAAGTEPIPVSGRLAVGRFTTGKPDEIAVVDAGSVTVVGRDPGGTFTTLGSSAVALPDLTAVTAGAFGSTTAIGLAAVDQGGATVSTLLGNGDGTFSQGPDTSTGLGAPCTGGFCLFSGESITTGTFNADAYPDVAVGSQDGRVSVLLGQASPPAAAGSFALAPGSPFTAADSAVTEIAAAPFGGGPLDGLATANYSQGGCREPCVIRSDSASVLLPSGGGAFSQAPGSPYHDGGVTTTVAAGDFNGDGRPDVAFGDVFSCHGDATGVLLNLARTPPSGVFPADGCAIPKPTVATTPVSGLSLTGATINGTVDQHFQPLTDCHFAYGSGALNHTVPCTPSGRPGDLSVSATLTGLKGLTHYEYALVAATAGGTVQSPTQTFQTCESPERKFGAVDAIGCFTSRHGGAEWDAHGPVDVNGMVFTPDAGGGISIDQPGAKLHISGRGDVSGGTQIPLLHWAQDFTLPLSTQPQTLFSVNVNAAKQLHLPLSGSLTGALVSATAADGKSKLYGWQLSGAVSLKPIGDPGTASVTLTTYAGLGVRGVKVAAQPASADPRFEPWDPCNPGAKYAGFKCVTNQSDDYLPGSHLESTDPRVIQLGPFQVTDFVGSLDLATHVWQFQAGLAIGRVMPGPLSSVFPTLSLGGTFGPDGLDSFHAGDSNLDWTLGPFQIQGITFDLTFRPHFGIGGQINANILRDVDFLKKLHLDQGAAITGGFKFQQGNSGFDIRINAPVPLFGLPINGYVEFDNRDDALRLLLGGSFSQDYGPVSVNANVDGAVQIHPSVHLQLSGDGTASAYGVSVGAHAVLSDAGFGACGEVHLLVFSGEIGFKHFWAPFPGGETDFQGCDFSGLYTISSGGARDAAAGRTVVVRPGTAREEFAAIGASGPPDVILTGPHGETVTTPARADRIQVSGGTLAVAVSSSRTTWFIVSHPRPGRWRLSAAPGAAPPLAVRLADPMVALALHAQVSGRGSRRTLSWRMRAQRGVRVSFIQEGGREEQIIATGRPAGRTRFTVAPGRGGRRTVIGLVTVDGIPRQRLSLTTFHADAPVGPAVSRAVYTVARGALSARWHRARAAGNLLVSIELRGNLLRFALGGRATGLRVKLPAGARVRRVVVVASTVGGLRGRSVSAALRR